MSESTNERIGERTLSRRLALRTSLISVCAWALTGCAGLPMDAQAGEAVSSRVPAPKAIEGKGYRLVKDWDFARTVTDERRLREEFFTRYIYSDGKLDYLNDEWQRFRDNDNHRIRDGKLSLVAHVRGGLKPGGIESGMLRSKWTGKYGYIEARMKVPSGRGMWPAFWLNPEDKVWPPEIDIVEIVDNGRDTPRNSFHYVHGKGTRKPSTDSTQLDKHGAYRPGIDYSEGFHTFAVEWTEDKVRHYVDDALVVERTYEWRHNDGRDAGPAHVLINLSVGGKWPGPPDASTVFPAELKVAYIRVWQK